MLNVEIYTHSVLLCLCVILYLFFVQILIECVCYVNANVQQIIYELCTILCMCNKSCMVCVLYICIIDHVWFVYYMYV